VRLINPPPASGLVGVDISSAQLEHRSTARELQPVKGPAAGTFEMGSTCRKVASV